MVPRLSLEVNGYLRPVDLLRETIRAILSNHQLEEQVSPQDYERVVIRALKKAGAAGRIKRATTHDAWRPDADIRIGDEFHYVEVKANGRAQMGGGSVSYRDGGFQAAGLNFEMSQDIADLLNDLNDSSLRNGIERLLTFLSSRSRQFTGVPISGFDDAKWERAIARGMLLPINRTFESSVDAIAQHYARKSTYYIQIGGAGLFRLGDANPANLPVPKLEGKVQLEVRLARAGGKPTAGLRVQARLLARNASPYTLDDPESVAQLVAATRQPPRRGRPSPR